MDGYITLTLKAKTPLPDTGSSMPDLGHVGYYLAKTIPDIEFKDSSGKTRKISEKFEIDKIQTYGE